MSDLPSTLYLLPLASYLLPLGEIRDSFSANNYMEAVPVAFGTHYRKYLSVLTVMAGLFTAGFAHANPFSLPTPDLVLVEKSEKKLYLMNNGAIIREYAIALGKNPVGHKVHEGDGRTPEGRYVLDWRNPNSKFHRSIHISYPNATDERWASDRKKPAGDFIMIHGSPSWVPSSEWAAEWLQKEDWTDGCIAVTNEQMDEIWRLVADGTPIEIWP